MENDKKKLTDILKEHKEEIIGKMKEADADAYRYTHLYFTVCIDEETGEVWVHEDSSSYFSYVDDCLHLLKTYNHQCFDILFDVQRSNSEIFELCGLTEEERERFAPGMDIKMVLKESYRDSVEEAREKAIGFEVSEKDYEDEFRDIVMKCAQWEEQ